MAILDIIILVVLAIGIVRGLRTGFIKQVAGLVGLVLSFALAASFMEPVGVLITERLGVSDGLGPLIAFVSIFIVVRMAVHLVAGGAEKLIDTVKLSGLDRLGGGLAGGVKSALVLSLIFMFIGLAELPDRTTRESSDLYPTVYRLVPDAWSFISEQSPAFEEFRRKVEERLDLNAGTIRV